MRKVSKRLAAIAGLALMIPTGASAQAARSAYGADGYGFVEAVKSRDNNKVLGYLESNGAAMINFRNDKGESALHVVTTRRDGDWLAYFLAKGGDVNLGNGAGDTPLHLAARGGWEEGVQTLLDYRAAVDRPNRLGETPLIAAVQARQLQIIRRLLQAGANPDRRDSASGRSARDYAKLDTRSGAAILQLMDTVKGRTGRPVAGPKI
ncbi:ankyrin repeat domain-containing protein [Sphingomonas sp. KRR8]|uniref:ankyrin repeat domain-containing protein n=1 Tax=Sphingomonas sp. KRR8 TaxID=2942996 RepID=UPI002021F0C8|nr:ankyrin repeat domain-containing protein [Sphingomonas sp. KRR8]URD60213.1 ankyrin repeat domain-containing protein [Sphingomonas sp. KRR8]